MRPLTSTEPDTDANLGAGSGDPGPVTTRRTALRLASGGVASALLVVRAGDRATAQEATPTAELATQNGYAVMRTRVVKVDASTEDLTTVVQDGFVPIVRQIPGFIDYYIVQNFETRERTSVSIFTDKAGTEESTKQASAFVQDQGLTDYYEDATPIITQGQIVVTA
jgi:hypothetical protein